MMQKNILQLIALSAAIAAFPMLHAEFDESISESIESELQQPIDGQDEFSTDREELTEEQQPIDGQDEFSTDREKRWEDMTEEELYEQLTPEEREELEELIKDREALEEFFKFTQDSPVPPGTRILMLPFAFVG